MSVILSSERESRSKIFYAHNGSTFNQLRHYKSENVERHTVYVIKLSIYNIYVFMYLFKCIYVYMYLCELFNLHKVAPKFITCLYQVRSNLIYLLKNNLGSVIVIFLFEKKHETRTLTSLKSSLSL